MDYLKELIGRTNLSGAWETWSPAYRVLAIAIGLAVAYWALRVAVPVVLQALRPALFVVFVLAAVWALFPEATCSIQLFSKLPILCAR